MGVDFAQLQVCKDFFEKGEVIIVRVLRSGVLGWDRHADS